MIPDFISAIYLWIAGKVSGPYPLWRSWFAPVLLATVIIAVAALLVAIREDEPPPTPVTAVVEYVVEIENLKARLATAEANTLALVGTVNELVVAINRVQASPNLSNLATKGELELVRLKVLALEKKLEEAGMIHDRVLSTLTLDLDELKQRVEELEEELTAHTDNATIHREVLK